MVGKGSYERNGNGDGGDVLMFLVRLGLLKRQKPLGAQGVSVFWWETEGAGLTPCVKGFAIRDNGHQRGL